MNKRPTTNEMADREQHPDAGLGNKPAQSYANKLTTAATGPKDGKMQVCETCGREMRALGKYQEMFLGLLRG